MSQQTGHIILCCFNAGSMSQKASTSSISDIKSELCFQLNIGDAGPLKQLGRFASLNHNINFVVDHTPVDVDHSAHAGGLTMCTQGIMTTHLR